MQDNSRQQRPRDKRKYHSFNGRKEHLLPCYDSQRKWNSLLISSGYWFQKTREIVMCLHTTLKKTEINNFTNSEKEVLFKLDIHNFEKVVRPTIPNTEYKTSVISKQFSHLRDPFIDDHDTKAALPVHHVHVTSDFSMIEKNMPVGIKIVAETVAVLTKYG